jgi:hypothetical protein
VIVLALAAACRAEPEARGEGDTTAPKPPVTASPAGVATTADADAPTARDRSTASTSATSATSATSSTLSTVSTVSTSSTVSIAPLPTLAATTTAPALTPPTTTSCTTVVHLGDSTSAGLFDAQYMPDPADALPAQYERVGVRALYIEVSGGRSTIETIGGEANAFDTVRALRDTGYRGCWVVAIGTNDAANVAIGGVPDLTTRLDRMMFLFGSDPVLWVDAVTRVAEGPYADVNMQVWNEVLDAAESRFPSLRVFRWSDVALDEWFQSDGIHYTSGGSAWRSHAIADALVAAFPASPR